MEKRKSNHTFHILTKKPEVFTVLRAMCFLQYKPKQRHSPSSPQGVKSKLITTAVTKEHQVSGATDRARGKLGGRGKEVETLPVQEATWTVDPQHDPGSAGFHHFRAGCPKVQKPRETLRPTNSMSSFAQKELFWDVHPRIQGHLSDPLWQASVNTTIRLCTSTHMLAPPDINVIFRTYSTKLTFKLIQISVLKSPWALVSPLEIDGDNFSVNLFQSHHGL